MGRTSICSSILPLWHLCGALTSHGWRVVCAFNAVCKTLHSNARKVRCLGWIQATIRLQVRNTGRSAENIPHYCGACQSLSLENHLSSSIRPRGRLQPRMYHEGEVVDTSTGHHLNYEADAVHKKLRHQAPCSKFTFDSWTFEDVWDWALTTASILRRISLASSALRIGSPLNAFDIGLIID